MSDYIITFTPYFKKSVIKELYTIDPNIWIKTRFSDSQVLITSKLNRKKFTKNLLEKSPIFIKHIMPVTKRGRIIGNQKLDKKNILSSVEKITSILKKEKFAVQCRIVSGGQKGLEYSSKDIEVCVGENYFKKGCTPFFSDTEIQNENIKIISIFINKNNYYVGFSSSEENLNFHCDEYRICSKTGREISRAENKLKEALAKFNVKLNGKGKALDIGAAPGGWSKVLADYGYEVIAVDPGNLHPKLHDNPKIKHYNCKIENLDFKNHFDIIVNDMNIEPQVTSEIIDGLAHVLKDNGLIIVTLKLPNKIESRIKASIDILNHNFEVLAIKNLFHNRQEITALLRKRGMEKERRKISFRTEKILMKKSKYNIPKRYENRHFIVNTLNSNFIEVSENDYDIYKNKKVFKEEDFDRDIFENLRKGKFLIPIELDELKILKTRYKREQLSKKILTITVAPSLKCNFKCSYCYEDKKEKIINKNDQTLIIEFIENQVKKGYKKLNLVWFGGEPLLTFDIIKNLSKKIIDLAKKYKIKYSAFVTTNGYLLTDKIIKQFNDLKINQIYITLDGVGKIHDQRRKLANGEPTFKKITENIKLLKRYGLNVLIRMNVDKSNQNEIDALRVYVNEKLKFPLYLGLVRQYTDSCNIILKKCLTKKEYAKLLNDFNKKQDQKSNRLKFPKQLFTYCRACKISTFVIDPNLNLYRCENDIGRVKNRIGNIRENDYGKEFENINEQIFYKWSPFDYKKCKICVLLPICMGGCPFMGIKNSDPECEIYKYNFYSFLKKYIMCETVSKN